MNKEAQTDDSPHVITLPPLIFAAGFALGLVIEWVTRVRIFSPYPCRILGGVAAAAAGVLAFWASQTMRRAGTNIDPRRPTTAIVTGGPFRFTRNPLYLSLTLLSIGAALFFDIVWALLALVPVLAVVQLFVIRREERYLEAKFGAPYLEYKRKVRRWL